METNECSLLHCVCRFTTCNKRPFCSPPVFTTIGTCEVFNKNSLFIIRCHFAVTSTLFFDETHNKLFITFNYQLTVLEMKTELRGRTTSHDKPVVCATYIPVYNQVRGACLCAVYSDLLWSHSKNRVLALPKRFHISTVFHVQRLQKSETTDQLKNNGIEMQTGRILIGHAD